MKNNVSGDTDNDPEPASMAIDVHEEQGKEGRKEQVAPDGADEKAKKRHSTSYGEKGHSKHHRGSSHHQHHGHHGHHGRHHHHATRHSYPIRQQEEDAGDESAQKRDTTPEYIETGNVTEKQSQLSKMNAKISFGLWEGGEDTGTELRAARAIGAISHAKNTNTMHTFDYCQKELSKPQKLVAAPRGAPQDEMHHFMKNGDDIEKGNIKRGIDATVLFINFAV